MTNEERGQSGNIELRALNSTLNRWPRFTCQWFLLCHREATSTRRGPIGDGAFGLVPVCSRCADFADGK